MHASSTTRRKRIQSSHAISASQSSAQAEAPEKQMPESASIRLSFLPLIACVCVVVWFFRDFFEFGFDRVAGDMGDNR
jgi:hypothetical protein